MDIRIFKFTPVTKVEGPGVRACIQVQGCPIKCPGCAVRQTWSERGGRIVDTRELLTQILEGPSVEGVTFLGGEPFAQAAALAEIGEVLQEQGLSVMTFTGYWREDLEKAGREDFNALLSVTDLLIDGPFEREKADLSRPWVGSSNQRFHFLTSRYRHLAPTLKAIPNRLEVRMATDGRVFINGMAMPDDMAGLLQDLDSWSLMAPGGE